MSQLPTVRRPYLDSAKGIGIFLVVLGHSISLQEAPSSLASTIGTYIYSFHMPLFFVLGGLGLWYKCGSGKIAPPRFEIFHLMRRLVAPYLFWSGIYIILSAAIHIAQRQTDWLILALKSAFVTLCGRGIAPIWFLIALFFAEALFLLMYVHQKNSRISNTPFYWCIVLCGTAVLSVVLARVYNQFNLSEQNHFFAYPLLALFRTAPAFFFVCVGYLFGAISCRLRRRTRLLTFFICIIAHLIIFHFLSGHANLHTFNLYSPEAFLLTGTFGSAALILFCRMFSKALRLTRFLGRESLHIMVLHYPPFPILSWPLALIERLSVQSLFPIAAIFATGISYSVSAFLLTPAFRHLRKRFSRGK